MDFISACSSRPPANVVPFQAPPTSGSSAIPGEVSSLTRLGKVHQAASAGIYATLKSFSVCVAAGRRNGDHGRGGGGDGGKRHLRPDAPVAARI